MANVRVLRHDDSGPSDEVRALVHALFQAHYAELCRFAYRCVKSRALAEEPVQDVFLKVWKQEGAAGTERIGKAYLYRAVRNRALDYLKPKTIEQLWEGRARLKDAPAPPTLDRAFDSRDLARAARREIERLPERRREVFLLRREQDLSYEEIAETLGVSVKTVENRMGRALRLLKARLAPYLSAGLQMPRQVSRSSGRRSGWRVRAGGRAPTTTDGTGWWRWSPVATRCRCGVSATRSGASPSR